MIRRIGVVLGVGVLLLLLAIAAVVTKTLLTPSRQLDVPPVTPVTVDKNAAAEHLAGAVRFRTMFSFLQPNMGLEEFDKFHRFLEAKYPNVHRVLKREVVGVRSLLYVWPGKDASLKPVMLMAHQDVVPVAPGTEGDWQQPPFDGVRKDGFVWGRGAWDDKGNLIAQIEAVEMLVASGFQPERTIYLAFGHDEEVMGRGAKAIAELLKSRGVKLDFIIDEGLLVTEGLMPGIKKPVALIGIAEKGYLSVTLKAKATPGHSSMPPPTGQSAIAQLSAALQQIENHPFDLPPASHTKLK